MVEGKTGNMVDPGAVEQEVNEHDYLFISMSISLTDW
jgi:hypothetical protein